MKRFTTLLLLSLSIVVWLPIYAQDDEPQFQIEVEIQYGSSIDLKADLNADESPLRATAFLRPSSPGDTLVIEGEISSEPDTHRISAIVDMRPPKFKPFELISLFWQIDFPNGEIWTSPENFFRYEDNRFPWKEMSKDAITIHWVNGDIEYGENVLDLTLNSLNRISQTLGLSAPSSFALYIYPSRGDLQSALQLGGMPWVEGHALPELGVLLLAASDNPESMIGLERDIPHEITHLLLYARLGSSYPNLPAWLGEGLASLLEEQANPAYRFELERAVGENALLPMESLCSSFPMSESDALLAYAQSASFTQYLLDVYGMGGILQLLDAYQEGVSCTGGIQRIYQRSLSQLESEWRTLHLQAPSLWQKISPILPWGLLVALVIILLLIGVNARSRSSPNNKG